MELGKVDMKWYVLQAFSGFENKVKQTLEDTIKREGLEESFGEILVPTEEVLEIKEGQKKKNREKILSRIRDDKNGFERSHMAHGKKLTKSFGICWWYRR